MIIKNGNWNISTKIFKADERRLPRHLVQLLSNRAFKWQEKGAYLHLDKEAKAFYLIQEVKSFYKYLPFKHLMQDFSSQVLEWKQIFEDFS